MPSFLSLYRHFQAKTGSRTQYNGHHNGDPNKINENPLTSCVKLVEMPFNEDAKRADCEISEVGRNS